MYIFVRNLSACPIVENTLATQFLDPAAEQVRLAGVPETAPGSSDGRRAATATIPEPELGAEAAGGVGGQTHVDGGRVAAEAAAAVAAAAVKETPVPSVTPAARGALKAEDVSVDQTDMAWSGSIHCM